MLEKEKNRRRDTTNIVRKETYRERKERERHIHIYIVRERERELE